MQKSDQDFLAFVTDQLTGLVSLSPRPMFGGIGLYQGTTFFGIIDEGRLYFVTDDGTRSRYEAQGMKPFQYAPGKTIHTYYEVPVDVLESDTDLLTWARDAVDAQKRRNEKNPVPSRRKRVTKRTRRQ